MFSLSMALGYTSIDAFLCNPRQAGEGDCVADTPDLPCSVFGAGDRSGRQQKFLLIILILILIVIVIVIVILLVLLGFVSKAPSL